MRHFSIYKGFYICFLLILIGCHGSGKSKSVPKLNAQERTCIKKILDLDARLGKIRNHACEQISLSQTVSQYVEGFKEVDFAQCPAAFQNAFQSHLNAWFEMTAITDHYPGERGEMHVLFEKFEKGNRAPEFKAGVKKIWDTWAEVETFITFE